VCVRYRGNIFTEPLPSNDRGYFTATNDKRIQIQTHRLVGGICKYADEMGSGAMMYIPNFIKTGPVIQKFIRGIHRHTEWRSHKLTFIF
jgi:hypothetical protein